MFRISRSFADLWMLRVHSLLSEVNFSSWLVYSITYGVVTFFLENLETSISHAIQKRPEKSLERKQKSLKSQRKDTGLCFPTKD